MTAAQAELIIKYYADIPGQMRQIARERQEIEDEYSPLRGHAPDGMPHAVRNGDSTADAAIKIAESGCLERLRELDARHGVLRGDARVVRREIDCLNSVYKIVLVERYEKRHSWAEVAEVVRYSESHTRRLGAWALRALGTAMEGEPMAGELLARASDARD